MGIDTKGEIAWRVSSTWLHQVLEESVRIFFSIASTDPSECSIALDNVAHEIAAEIDGFNDDDATMEELSEDEDFYPEVRGRLTRRQRERI